MYYYADNTDSDDDFVNPPPKRAKTVEEVKTKVGFTKTKAARTSTTAPTKVDRVYHYYTGEKIKIRSAPSNICKMIFSLDSQQMATVNEIGFGNILEFNMDSYPTGMGYWLVKNYDAETCTLNVGSHLIQITPELVHKIFGIPMGKIEVEEHQRPRDSDPVVAEWKGQFDVKVKRILAVQFREYMEKYKRNGRLFILNFLVFFFTFMGETTQNNSVNLFFLPSVKKGMNVKSFNWCSYMITLLNRSKKTWKPDKHFHGPLALLLV